MNTYFKKALKNSVKEKSVVSLWVACLIIFFVSILFLVILYIQISSCNMEMFEFVSNYEKVTGTATIRNISEQNDITSALVEVNVSFENSDEVLTKTIRVPISNNEGEINVIEEFKIVPEYIVKDVNIKVTNTEYLPSIFSLYIVVLVTVLLHFGIIIFIIPIESINCEIKKLKLEELK